MSAFQVAQKPGFQVNLNDYLVLSENGEALAYAESNRVEAMIDVAQRLEATRGIIKPLEWTKSVLAYLASSKDAKAAELLKSVDMAVRETEPVVEPTPEPMPEPAEAE